MKENRKVEEHFSLSSPDMLIAWVRAEVSVLNDCPPIEQAARLKLLDACLEGIDMVFNAKLRLVESQAELVRRCEKEILMQSGELSALRELIKLHKEAALIKDRRIADLLSELARERKKVPVHKRLLSFCRRGNA